MDIQLAMFKQQNLSSGRIKAMSLAVNIKKWSGNTNKPVHEFLPRLVNGQQQRRQLL
jgi:hypothetical protein